MAFKNRTEPFPLKILKYLDNRKELSEEERHYLYRLKKGYEGEVKFDALTEELQSECYLLNDLLLEINTTEFQMDSSLINQTTLYLFEVKNLDGEHVYDSEADKFIKIPDKEINNPLHQLNRKETLLRQFLKKHGFSIPIEPYLIFINPEFTLLHAPINSKIILPTQLNQFMKKLDRLPSKLGVTQRKLADYLVAAHKPVSSHKQEISYQYDELKKGISCCACHSLDMVVHGNKLVCLRCGAREPIDAAVLRCVEEIRVLFPGMKITTNLVQEWCGVIESKKTIGRILNKHFNQVGYGQWTYYE